MVIMSNTETDAKCKVSPGLNINRIIKWNPYLSRIRINGKQLSPFSNQLAFLRSDEMEVLYGGASRGGKSVAMLIAGLQYVDSPTYNGIIFRKTYQELSKGDGLIPMSIMWLKQFESEGVHWNSDNMQWEFPSGAVLGFGYLASENDKYKYIGQAYQFIGFDELTQQPEENYTFLFSRLVRTEEQKQQGIPLRMRSTTNPNGPHVAWAYDRFINKRTRPNVRQSILDMAKEKVARGEVKPEDINEDYIKHRMPKFISSLATDNPYIDIVSYMDSLDKLDPVTRAQLRDGNWDIRALGNMFNRDWFEKVPYAKVPVHDLMKVRFWDLASTKDGDFTASCHLGYDKKAGVFYILEMTLFKGTPREVEREVYLASIDDGSTTSIYMEREPGSAGMHNIDHYKRKVIPPGWVFREERVSGDKESRARPVSAAADKGLIKIAWSHKSDKWFNPVMDQMETFPEGEYDDACLAEGTIISTVEGNKFIENISINDEIICKEGKDKVIAVKMTNDNAEVYELKFSNGETLIATGNHPLYCLSRKKYIKVDDLSIGEECLWLEKEHTQLNMKKSNSMGLHIDDTQTPIKAHIGTISDPRPIMSGRDMGIITKNYGRNITDQSQEDVTFIISMEIPATTTSTISSALNERNIFQNIVKNGIKIIKEHKINTLRISEDLPRNGIKAKKGEHGIKNTLKKSLKIESQRYLYAKPVEKNFNHIIKQQDIAQNIVGPLEEERQLNVNGVEVHSSPPKELKHVVKIVKLISVSKLSERRKVWNIRTKLHHNYFANNINVHNCDALASAFNVLSKRIYSKGQYIGKVDWLTQTEAPANVKLQYGPNEEQVTLNSIFTGRKVKF